MQEELEHKAVAILYNGGKLSARTLARLAAVLVRMAQRAYQKGLTPHGRQSVKKLMNHRTGTEAAEYVGAPRQFDRVARKWNVDYAFYKTGPDKYLLFFKAGQADAITACFERYSRRLLEQSKSSRIPIREQLKKAAEQLVKEPPKTQERTKEVVREER